jgi:hypothetical protein
VPPEVAALLEMTLEQRQRWPATGGGGEQGQRQQGQEGHQQPQLEEQQRHEAEEDGPGSSASARGATAGGGGGFPHESSRPFFFKTRLCGSFTQTGCCARASSCTFAHGWQELRQPGAPHEPAGGVPSAQV